MAVGFGVLLFARPLTGALAVLWAIGTLGIANGALRCLHAGQLAMAPKTGAAVHEREFRKEEPPMSKAA